MAQHTAWSDVPLEELSPTVSRRLISGENMMASMFALKEGAYVPAHRHVSEQICYVVSGHLRFTMEDGSTFELKSGEVLVIPSNVEHAAEALEDSDVLDYFSPVREDWLSGDDAYLRGE